MRKHWEGLKTGLTEPLGSLPLVSQVGTSWVKELESGKLESKRGYQEWGRKDLESGRRKAKTRAGRSG